MKHPTPPTANASQFTGSITAVWHFKPQASADATVSFIAKETKPYQPR